MHACNYACMYVCMYAWMYVCMYVCKQVSKQTKQVCMYIRISLYIYIYATPPPPYLPFCVFSAKKSPHLPFPVVNAFGYKFSSSRLQRILHHVCARRNCVCCVMVLPVFVTYVPESALITAGRATAGVDETLVHVAYMHICGRGSGVTCLRRRDLLRLKSQHGRLNTDQGVKVITRTTTISSSFD